MTSAFVWAGATKGLEQVADYLSPAAVQGRQQDREARELEMQQLRAQTQQANSQLLKSQTYAAFDRFEADMDVRHLNNFITEAKKNPAGSSIYGDTVRVDKLYKSSENDQLLRQIGVQDLDAAYADSDLLLVTTNTDRKLVPISSLYAATGYNDYMTDKQLTNMERKARVSQMLRAGQSGAAVSLKEQVVKDLMNNRNITLSEAYEIVNKMERSGQGSSAQERIISALQQEAAERGEDMSTYDALQAMSGSRRQETNEERFVKEFMSNNPGATYEEASTAYANRTQTGTQKEIADVEAIKDELDSINFLDTDLAKLDANQRAKIHRNIAKIEDLRGVKIDATERRVMRDIRNLTQLGGKAGTELTESETGIMDTMLNSFRKYLVDEVGGKEATSAYETFRNSIRNALYGASLTQSEINAFQAAAGSLGQQLQPVLAQLKVQMQTLKNQLTSVRDMNDPYLAHYYIGQDVDKVDEAIRQIDLRLDTVGAVNKPKLVAKPTLATPPIPDGTKPKRSMEDIWAEATGGK